MSQPYTPTTEDVRAAYENRAVIGPPAMAADYEEAEAQFNRWLATVKAEVLRGVANSLTPAPGSAPLYPAVIRAALYSRADRFEGEA